MSIKLNDPIYCKVLWWLAAVPALRKKSNQNRSDDEPREANDSQSNPAREGGHDEKSFSVTGVILSGSTEGLECSLALIDYIINTKND